MIKTVLLAADLGIQTAHVLQHAVDLANQYQAKLVIVHAVEPLGTLGHALLQAYLTPETTKTLTTTGLNAVVQEVKTQVIDSLTEQYLGGDQELLCLAEVVVQAGVPVTVITETAKQQQADLIVLGSHSEHSCGLQSLGSVTQKVLQQVNVPVYVVPDMPYHWNDSHVQQSMPF